MCKNQRKVGIKPMEKVENETTFQKNYNKCLNYP